MLPTKTDSPEHDGTLWRAAFVPAGVAAGRIAELSVFAVDLKHGRAVKSNLTKHQILCIYLFLNVFKI
jgi:hypothetical protein